MLHKFARSAFPTQTRACPPYRPCTTFPIVICLNSGGELKTFGNSSASKRKKPGSHPLVGTRAVDSQSVDRAGVYRSPSFPLKLGPVEGSQGRLRSCHEESLALLSHMHALHLWKEREIRAGPEKPVTTTDVCSCWEPEQDLPLFHTPLPQQEAKQLSRP